MSEDKQKAEALNDQFRSVFNKESTGQIPNLGRSPFPDITRLNTSSVGVLDQLRKLNPSKAQGQDGIPPWFLWTYAEQLAASLQDLFQTSINTGKFLRTGEKPILHLFSRKGIVP